MNKQCLVGLQNGHVIHLSAIVTNEERISMINGGCDTVITTDQKGLNFTSTYRVEMKREFKSIKPVEKLPSDLFGWFHPAIAENETISDDAEVYTDAQWNQLQINLGVDIKAECHDRDDFPEMTEDDWGRCEWTKLNTPKSPTPNHFLIAVFDSEDGVVFWWAKPKTTSSQ